MIVLYVGQNSDLKSLLSQVMGPAIVEGEVPAEIIRPAEAGASRDYTRHASRNASRESQKSVDLCAWPT